MITINGLVLTSVLLVLSGCSEVRVKRIVGGDPAASPPPPRLIKFPDDPPPSSPPRTTSTTPEPDFNSRPNDAIVFTRRGSHRAEVQGSKESDNFYSFKGIRYAQAPVGRLRFQRPIRQHLNGKVEATKYGPPCPQPLPNNRGVLGKEDCLFLNIYTPKVPERREKKGAGGLPVIFWIHGGGFRRGSGAQYGVRNLVSKGVVVVTINYRLGSLGFLSQKTRDAPGNVGLFDINAALRWVKEYVRFFGGNARHIVPSGQGTGASAACMLPSSKFNSESIRGVFAMSGSSVSSFATDTNETSTAAAVGEFNSCRDLEGIKFIRCMQKIPYEKIIESDSQFQDKRTGDTGEVGAMGAPLNPSPTVEGEDDGRFLPYFMNLPPIDALKAGKFVKVPLLTGVTKEETGTAVNGGLFDDLQKKLTETTNFLTNNVFKELLNLNTGLYSNGKVNPTLSTLFNSDDYLKALSSSLTSSVSQLQKLIEVTTDAIFNLPAFLTTQLWSKNGNAYLYQFDHESEKSTGKKFLDGLPLVQTDESKPSKGLGHGDDLIYLFDPQTLEGDPINEDTLSSDKDKKVREHFTTMVAEFARSGKPEIKDAGVSGWNPFTDDSSDYLVLNENPHVESGFRKCQMALWAGLGSVLKSAECATLNAGDLVGQLTGLTSSGLLDQTALKNIGSTLTEPISGLTNNLNTAAGDTTSLLTNPLGGVTGLLGGGGGNKDQQKQKPQTIKNPLSSIFG